MPRNGDWNFHSSSCTAEGKETTGKPDAATRSSWLAHRTVKFNSNVFAVQHQSASYISSASSISSTNKNIPLLLEQIRAGHRPPFILLFLFLRHLLLSFSGVPSQHGEKHRLHTQEGATAAVSRRHWMCKRNKTKETIKRDKFRKSGKCISQSWDHLYYYYYYIYIYMIIFFTKT
ncbi:hypothetical protein ABL78_3324 [Leptomonas seymouri]|uniref:Uncharacterized protein n=1 Tax=Leptomonas seymouri TaxID=5684 RepID=A0A0N1I6B0_LEPSE|nr:hypothetical protein ABL78_3324 [Leptomonas seymouri]|eukprot:KPI87573.1 hypothetical protein ABL78_3324 [Leptomonas seymouri]